MDEELQGESIGNSVDSEGEENDEVVDLGDVSEEQDDEF